MSGYDDNDTKERKKSSAGGVVFLILFIGLLLAMIVMSKINGLLCGACFGLMFALVGGAILPGGGRRRYFEERFVGVLLLLGGLAVSIFFGSLFWLSRTGRITPEQQRFFNTAFMSCAFVAAGALIAVLPPVFRAAKRKRCTEEVTAECIRLNSHRTRKHTRVYAPVWRFYFDGAERIVNEKTYSNISVPDVGSTRSIRINPDDPDDIYREASGTSVFLFIFGIAFAAAGILMFLAAGGKL